MSKSVLKFMGLMLVAAVLAVSLAGCGPVVKTGKAVVDEYHGLIEAYQAARKAAANGTSCLVLTFSQMQAQAMLVNNYLVADIEKTRVYREALAQYGNKFHEQTNAYIGPDGQALAPSQLDLNELVKAGATPADMSLTIQVYATAFTEAPLAAIDSAPTINAQRIFSEQYNLAFACITDWNDAVERYNVERNKIPGDAVGRVAERLGVKELPQELPYFIMQGSTTPPTIPSLPVNSNPDDGK